MWAWDAEKLIEKIFKGCRYIPNLIVLYLQVKHVTANIARGHKGTTATNFYTSVGSSKLSILISLPTMGNEAFLNRRPSIHGVHSLFYL